MAWLLRSGEVLASAERPDTLRRGAAGLRSRRSGTGAVLLSPARWTHSMGDQTGIDVAFLDEDLVVLATTRLAPHRVAFPRRHAHTVLVAEAGAFARWQLRLGDQLEVKD